MAKTDTKDKRKPKSKDLFWKRESAWGTLCKDDAAKMEAYCAKYLDFVSQAKTEREAHDLALGAALEVGYRHLDSADSLAAGDKVVRSTRGKSLFLAHIGEKPVHEGVRILGGHIDAPRLDAKPKPLYEDSELVLLDTHYYGGIRKYQWVTMPLAIHGVVVRQDGTVVPVAIGEDLNDPVFVITDLLPHLAKDQNKKTLSEGITGENLNVLFGSRFDSEQENDEDSSDDKAKKDSKEKVKSRLLDILKEKYNIEEEDLASAELEVVPAGPARELGLDRSMMLAYAHDDRICAYASLRALLELEQTPEYTAVVLLADREEVGSVGATGMDSLFFENTIAEVLSRCGEPYSDLLVRRSLEASRMISADVSPLHDPNYPEVSSPNNMGRMNAGVVVDKYTGARGKSGCSEASAEFMADLRRIFNGAGVIWQTGELGKVDQGGGGTISMFLARYGMDVVDCGAGLLSMHAPWEVASKLDTFMMFKGYRAFLEDRSTNKS
ncbi:MAG: aminopeptidase [Verrucomicrobiota bacterium]